MMAGTFRSDILKRCPFYKCHIDSIVCRCNLMESFANIERFDRLYAVLLDTVYFMLMFHILCCSYFCDWKFHFLLLSWPLLAGSSQRLSGQRATFPTG